MEPNLCYLTCVIWDRKSHYLLWKDGGDFPDRFVSNSDGVICIKSTQNETQKISQCLGVRVYDTEICIIDIDVIWPLLRNTKQKRYLSSEEFKLILNGWNVIEDIARTLEFKLSPFSRRRRKSIQDVYEQIFVSADVLGIKPLLDDKRPALSSRERVIARDFLYAAWKNIRNHKKWRQSNSSKQEQR